MDMRWFIEVGFTVIAVGIGFLTLRWGVVSFKGQMNAQLFLEFTKRFDEIMEKFPEDTWSKRFNIEGYLPEPSEELTNNVLRYLNLCGEEYYLYKEKMLAESVWKIWEGELKRTLRTPLFQREWPLVRGEFEAYPMFMDYVDMVQGSRPPRS